jgi:hypothetical protein
MIIAAITTFLDFEHDQLAKNSSEKLPLTDDGFLFEGRGI